MADDATMTISAVILPDEISKTLSSQTYAYTPADATEGWYYKVVDVTTSSGNLIGTETFLQKGTYLMVVQQLMVLQMLLK